MSEGLSFAQICGKAEPKLDVLFIHGLTGDPKETWQSADGQLWPEWLHADLPDLAIFTLGYPASLFEKWAKKEMDLFERAANALEYMVSKGIGERPLVFVVHSLGGILAKQIIRRSCDCEDEAWQKVSKSVKMVVFLATPHNGASLAGAIKFALPHFSSSHVDLLSNNSGVLDDINLHYRSFANSNPDIKTVVYYEKFKTAKSVLVVPKESSDPGVAGTTPVPVDKDHVGICKPKDREDIVYLGIHRHLKGVLTAIPKDDHSANDDAFEEEGYTEKAEHDRRDLFEKLIAANLEHQYIEANNYQNKFAQRYLRLGLFSSAKEENDKLLAEVEQRFVTHVYHPHICKKSSYDDIKSSLQTNVIDPICTKRRDQKGFNEKTVLSALYFLTEQCHIRWDAPS